MTDLFISYSRRDLEFVKRLHAELKTRNRDVWIDLEDIPPTAAWLAEIYTGIEATNAFVFVISPDSLKSEVCKLELEYAVKHGKKLVPILHREIADQSPLHPALASHNWLFFRVEDDYERAFNLLNDALDTDLDYVRAHTRLLIRALEWENRQRDPSFILRGTDLLEAENWLRDAMEKTPEPTPLHTQYIIASRQAETRRQRVLLIAVTAAFVLSLVLAVFAFIQWREAEAAREKASEAQSTAVAALINVNDTRATASAQEDTFRATIRALGQQAQVVALEAAPTQQIAPGLESPTDTITPAPLVLTAGFPPPSSAPFTATAYPSDAGGEDVDVSDIALTATTLAEVLFATPTALPTGQVEGAATPTREGMELPNTGGGGGGAESVMLIGLAQYQMAASDADRLIAIDNLVYGLQRTDYPYRRTLTGHNGPVLSAAYSPNGALLASGSDDNTVIVWDTANWNRVGLPYYGHEAGVTSVAFSPNGQQVASGSRDGSIILWNLANAEASRRLRERDNNWVLSVAFSPDGTALISGGSEPVVKIWSLETGAVIRRLEGVTGTVFSVTVSPDGRLIAAGDSSGVVAVWDAASGTLLHQLTAHDGAVLSINFSPDSRTLASGGVDNNILLWDVDSGAILHRLEGANNVILNVDFSPDGAILAAGTAENAVRLWDTASGQPLGDAFREYGDWVYGVDFSPDGAYLASSSSDGSITILPMGIETWSRLACEVAGRSMTEEEWVQSFPNQPYQDVCPPG